MRLVTCKENLNLKLKGIHYRNKDMERYLTEGELLLTNMKVYFRRNGQRVSETFE